MTQQVDVPQSLTHEQLPRLHSITNEVAKICRGQLRTYLDALAPLFRPRRVLGNSMDGAGKETVTGADQNFAELREIYFKACGRPFDLRKELPAPLESVPTQIQLYEWESLYDIRAGRELLERPEIWDNRPCLLAWQADRRLPRVSGKEREGASRRGFGRPIRGL